MLFDTDTLTLFALATLATYVAPGADMAYVASRAIPGGVWPGLWAGLGVLTGIAIQALAAAFGVTALFEASPIAFEVVRWAGIAYLLYLGVTALRSGDAALATASSAGAPALSIWVKGVAINLLNPKISLFFFSFLPQFVEPQRGHVFEQIMALGLMFFGGSVVWLAFLAVLFARLGSAIAGSRRALAWTRRLTGGSLIGFAGALAWSGLRSVAR